MNLCVISGTVENNAILRGKKTKALVFIVATQYSNGDAESEPMTSHVPCVLFNPPQDVEEALTTKGKGMEIELQGRVNSNRSEGNGEPRSNAEVIVFTRTVKLGS